MEKKLLCITSGSYVYGAESVVLKVIGGLTNNNFKIFCAVNGWNDGAFIRELEKLKVPYKAIYLGWFYITKPLWTLDTIVHFPKAYFQYYNILKRSDSKFVYHYDYRSLFLLLPFLKKNNVYHVHATINTKMAKFILKYIDKKIVYYVACSNSIAKELIEFGIEKKKIKLIYNGVDFTNDLPQQNNNIIPTVFKIGIVGQINENKGQLVLINALAIVVKTFKNFKVHIFGTGDDALIKKLKELIEVNDLSDNIIWEGYVKDKSKIYYDLDFCVVPTLLTEAYGLVAVEPAVYYKPVIASKCGGLPEIVQDGETGLLFSPGDINELAEKLLYYFNNPGSIVSMGQKANEIYSKKFSETQMIDEFNNLLQ
ncbi:MAG: glycosyltransferase family 4 protein [Bacteroidota bacterium]